MEDIIEKTPLGNVLIVSITPYFLERGALWFEKNIKNILKTRKTHSFWQDNTVFLEKNQKISMSYFLRRLDELGYEKVFKLEMPGEFSHKGSFIELFPLNLKQAIRIDFFGNIIDSIEKLELKIKDEEKTREIIKKKIKAQEKFSDIKNLKKGDYLVHLDHGIGIYEGNEKLNEIEYYKLGYAKNDRLYVPLNLSRKLSRYVGFADPKIARLGSEAWQKVKNRVKQKAEKIARDLLQIYAKREISQREPYLAPGEIDESLKNTFLFEETPDQQKTMEEIEKDLKKTRPMDRLVCGDVGFGKTEIALRSMVRAVNSALRAVMLCPTTILAEQHYQNFKKRLKDLPIKLAVFSRLQSKKEQERAAGELKKGTLDIIIGTHRLLSSDIAPFLFKENGGLLVIDDEHKFGVKQKEKFKKMRETIDVLSLSATPIPRSLYLSLCSLRDISTIQTPPPGRLPIKTFVLPFSKKTIKEAIEKEVKRKGQVYYLHNRVQTIEAVKGLLEELVKGIKIGVAHGRMEKEKLLKVMEKFQKGEINVLLATTIIEAGIDIANVNTLIVADATKLGLGQAYQIRGRVGRSPTESFAYLLYPPKSLKGLAKERLKALKQAKELGSGYRIASQDMEMRGAGNILGKEQSGTINTVGLNLYCQMVSQAIEKMKVEGESDKTNCTLLSPLK